MERKECVSDISNRKRENMKGRFEYQQMCKCWDKNPMWGCSITWANSMIRVYQTQSFLEVCLQTESGLGCLAAYKAVASGFDGLSYANNVPCMGLLRPFIPR
jgi:hypothetical protein